MPREAPRFLAEETQTQSHVGTRPRNQSLDRSPERRLPWRSPAPSLVRAGTAPKPQLPWCPLLRSGRGGRRQGSRSRGPSDRGAPRMGPQRLGSPSRQPPEPWSEWNQDTAERVEGPRGEGCAVRGLACPVSSATQVDSRSEGDPSELTTRGPRQSEREDGAREMERFSPPLWSNLVFRREE